MHVNEGEGDFLVVGEWSRRHRLPHRPGAHTEVQELFGIPVISLQLVDPRFYHLDTALAVLDDRTVAYYPRRSAPAAAASCSGCPRRDPGLGATPWSWA